MKTYEELLEASVSVNSLGEFIADAVKIFEESELYKDAYIADRYYNKHNVTIEEYTKWLYTVTGRQVVDIYSADHRIKTQHFRRKVIQHSNYLLGNGIQLDKPEMKDKLGKNIDHQLIKLCKMAMVEGRSFGFWNADHLEVFGFCCTDKHAGFCPLYSDQSGEMMAGIRFSYVQGDGEITTKYTLYEPEGVTEFTRSSRDNNVVMVEERKAYKSITVRNKADGVLNVAYDNYGGLLPIIPMYASDTYESDLVGVREAIDCYDLIKSGLANTIDDASEIFWVVKNAGGMDDKDLARFLQRLRRTHAANVDSDAGEDAVPHTVDVPYEARKQLLEILRTDLYDDMMLIDRRTMSAAQKTEQELDMAYQPQDDYINDLEFYVYDFIDKLLTLAGIDSEATFTRNKVSNKTEHVSMVLSAANYISPECVIKHLPFLTPEEIEEEIKIHQSEQVERFFGSKNKPEEDEEEE